MSKQPEVLLGINIDHVATLRQARGTRYPDPVLAAQIAESAGADGITVHLREDQRHIQPRDVQILQQVVQTKLNLEMAVTPEMIAFACDIKPACCCLVPERREEMTTESGLDVIGQEEKIREACHQLREAGIRVSLFIDPEEKQIQASARCGAPDIELHTGEYAESQDEITQAKQLLRIQHAAKFASSLGLRVNAGHGLHYHNVQAIAAIPEIYELNIGHAVIARAVMSGMDEAVSTMKTLLRLAR